MKKILALAAAVLALALALAVPAVASDLDTKGLNPAQLEALKVQIEAMKATPAPAPVLAAAPAPTRNPYEVKGITLCQNGDLEIDKSLADCVGARSIVAQYGGPGNIWKTGFAMKLEGDKYKVNFGRTFPSGSYVRLNFFINGSNKYNLPYQLASTSSLGYDVCADKSCIIGGSNTLIENMQEDGVDVLAYVP